MAASINSWNEMRCILDGLNKKLLKKPNLPLAISQLNSLSLRMQDEELSRHSAICHAEQANIYQKMGNHNEERKQYLIAAHLLFDAFQVGLSGKSLIQSYFPNEIADFYSRAVRLCLEMKALRLAGLLSLEAGKVLITCEHVEMATEHVQRAVRLLEGEFFAHTRALYSIATIHFHLYQYEHLLADLDDLWMIVMKNRPRSLYGRRMLKDLEVITVLLLQRTMLCASGRHKVFKELYESTTVGGASENPRLRAVDESSLSPEEFSVFKNFLSSLSSGRVQEARTLLFTGCLVPKETTVFSSTYSKLKFLSPLGTQVILRFLDQSLAGYEK